MIRKTKITFSECDSFSEIANHLNDLYSIIRAQQATIDNILNSPVPKKEKTKKGKGA